MGYAYPAIYFDFVSKDHVVGSNMNDVERVIKHQLTAMEPQTVEHGLANVIYWGNATAGYRDHRVKTFVEKIELTQTKAFQALVKDGTVPTLQAIKDIRMPGFSGISFISKILMFLDPQKYCVLDLQLTSLQMPGARKAINRITFTTQIGITKSNAAAYDDWRRECAAISSLYYQGRYRAVDVERGLFHLIRSGHLEDAKEIYEAA